MNLRTAALLAASSFSFTLTAGDAPIRGFSQQQAVEERKWESQARTEESAARIGQYMKRMSAKPHMAGTPASRSVAEYALGLFKGWGLDAHIEQYEALMPTPRARGLELIAPKYYRAKLLEPPVGVDPDSFDKDQVPPFNAYSGSGDVSAPLVYANYGMPDDYEYLSKNHIDVKGKIVITRYGGGWRGLKPRLAAEHGAAGCLIYSDPKDDGYFRGDVYPKGEWRPALGVQRGSVMDMTLFPGDPLSPGWASEKGSKRLAVSEAKTLMKIPVIPIGYGDALPLMSALEGPVAPPEWRGALAITYHLGDGTAKVRLRVRMNNSVHPLYDVIARIPGSESPDEWVLAGNHHDAWVHGALDPLSGASSLLETARALAMLRKQGWQPKRTILIALWDGEEFGLIGSTEFAEKHAAELTKNLVAYINSDSNGKGRLGAGGSHTLEKFVVEVARDVSDPVSGKPLIDNMRVHSSTQTGRETAETSSASDYHMEALGSGSDYTSFLQHLGIASLNFGFGDDDGSGGIYHSAYDSYYWYTHFSDTNFEYCRTLSNVTATSLLRLADAPVLPFEFVRFADALSRYTDEIEKLEKNGLKINLLTLRTEIAALQKSAAALDAALQSAEGKLDAVPAQRLDRLNQTLFVTERKMLLDAGLPRRSWFKHAIYAPGTLTGYSVKTLPGVREAVEAGNRPEAQQELERVTEVVRELNQQAQKANQALSGL